MSCKVPIKTNVVKEITFYLIIMFSVGFVAFAVLVILFSYMIANCVHRRKSKNGKPAQEKQRAVNGMVVGEQDDFDQIPNNSTQKKQNQEQVVEMTESDKARAQKFREKQNTLMTFKNEMTSIGNSRKPAAKTTIQF